jgi:large subunit ribosomal protein L17
MLRNLASALFLTERDADPDVDPNPPKVKGRIITTLQKAKEVRPIIEKCITLARRTLSQHEAADELGTSADRNSEAWKEWRKSEKWRQWSQAMSPVVAARRKVIQLLGDKKAAKLCFEVIAPRFADRKGGYTRILRLSKPRLGDAGIRALLEFVGVHDRVVARAEKPSFGEEAAPAEAASGESAATE